ncbi:MAG: hypothetical protein JWQ79_1642 [Mucilaginibacter sp.]|jgi:hypothetical protein|nr:hypothetical protein [Mucilaginibacter sp.]
MKKVICMIALAAFSFSAVYAAPVRQTTDTTKTKVKEKKGKMKMKKKAMKKDTTKM